jgi:hypothetical protein
MKLPKKRWLALILTVLITIGVVNGIYINSSVMTGIALVTGILIILALQLEGPW